MTTAGRCFEAAWLVKGNGTRMMSPASNGIVGVVFRVVPDLGEGGSAHASGSAAERAFLLARADEVDKILDLGDALERECLDLFQEGLGVGHGLTSFLSCSDCRPCAWPGA